MPAPTSVQLQQLGKSMTLNQEVMVLCPCKTKKLLFSFSAACFTQQSSRLECFFNAVVAGLTEHLLDVCAWR